MKSLTLDAILSAGVELTYADAVAVVQQLIASRDTVAAEPDPGIAPPSIENVRLEADGSIHCNADCSYPTVTDTAALLDALLSRATSTRVPGGLRYIIGRARRDVDAPPFSSLADLSTALSRHEQRPRMDVLRELFARATAAAGGVRTFAGAAVPPPAAATVTASHPGDRNAAAAADRCGSGVPRRRASARLRRAAPFAGCGRRPPAAAAGS